MKTPAALLGRSVSRLTATLTICCGLVGSSLVAAQEAAREVKFQDLTLKVPAGWKQQPPSNNLRLGQFEIPAVEGDKEPAELTVFNFGIGGGVKANVDRWVEQFQADGRQVKVTQGKCPQGEYVLADVSGTYKKPVGPPILRKTESAPAYRMLGLILGGQKGDYFLKLTGPEKTVAAAAESFRVSFGGNANEEKPYDTAKAE